LYFFDTLEFEVSVIIILTVALFNSLHRCLIYPLINFVKNTTHCAELLGFAMDAFSLEEYHPSSEPNKLIFGTQPSKDQSILQQVKNTTSSNLMETLS
jgi:hypothetical protein